MIRRLLCWFGDLIGKDWHKWGCICGNPKCRAKGFCLYCGKMKYSQEKKLMISIPYALLAMLFFLKAGVFLAYGHYLYCFMCLVVSQLIIFWGKNNE